MIPVIGSAAVTVLDRATGQSIPLHQHLAPKLARALGPESPSRFLALNDAAREILLTGGERRHLHIELGDIIDHLDAEPPQSLVDLAGITDFCRRLSENL